MIAVTLCLCFAARVNNDYDHGGACLLLAISLLNSCVRVPVSY